MLQGDDGTVRRARRLRKEMSLPEVLLWRRLKSRPSGFKFRKQHPAKPFVLDFYCHEARLIIEIDGISHDMGDRPERDTERDRLFASKGLRVVRIPATEVLCDADAVAQSIVSLCEDARNTA